MFLCQILPCQTVTTTQFLSQTGKWLCAQLCTIVVQSIRSLSHWIMHLYLIWRQISTNYICTTVPYLLMALRCLGETPKATVLQLICQQKFRIECWPMPPVLNDGLQERCCALSQALGQRFSSQMQRSALLEELVRCNKEWRHFDPTASKSTRKQLDLCQRVCVCSTVGLSCRVELSRSDSGWHDTFLSVFKIVYCYYIWHPYVIL